MHATIVIYIEKFIAQAAPAYIPLNVNVMSKIAI